MFKNFMNSISHFLSDDNPKNMIPKKCPNCYATTKINKYKPSSFCEYCGGEVQNDLYDKLRNNPQSAQIAGVNEDYDDRNFNTET